MFLRQHTRSQDGKEHTYGSLVETVRTPDGPRQRTLCYWGELNHSAQARWLKTIEVFNAEGESRQLKLFPSDIEPPPDDATVARVQLDKVRLERARRLGDGFLGLELWKRLGLDRHQTDLPFSNGSVFLLICLASRQLYIWRFGQRLTTSLEG